MTDGLINFIKLNWFCHPLKKNLSFGFCTLVKLKFYVLGENKNGKEEKPILQAEDMATTLSKGISDMVHTWQNPSGGNDSTTPVSEDEIIL